MGPDMAISATQLMIGLLAIFQLSIAVNLWFVRKWMSDMENERVRMHERANALQTLLNNVQLNYVLKSDWRDFRSEVITKLENIERHLRGQRDDS